MGVHWSVVIFFCCGKLWAYAHIPKPQIANPKFVTNNPTLTTVALEKPFCVFVGSVSKWAPYKVYLYVMVDSATTSSTSMISNSKKPLSATFQQTNGGQFGPYKAAVFNVPNCVSPPQLTDAADVAKISAVLTQYLIRVGNDTGCLYDTDVQKVCNSPLSEDTFYRFKFVLVNTTADIVQDQTLWSDPIKTKKLKPSSSIDPRPGQRDGSMIFITFILSGLMLVLIGALLFATSYTPSSTRDRSGQFTARQTKQHTY